jgi:hypothetical protein
MIDRSKFQEGNQSKDTLSIYLWLDENRLRFYSSYTDDMNNKKYDYDFDYVRIYAWEDYTWTFELLDKSKNIKNKNQRTKHTYKAQYTRSDGAVISEDNIDWKPIEELKAEHKRLSSLLDSHRHLFWNNK